MTAGGHRRARQLAESEYAVGITTFSHNVRMTIGVMAASEPTPDIAVLAYGTEEGVEEQLAHAGAEYVNTSEKARV